MIVPQIDDPHFATSTVPWRIWVFHVPITISADGAAVAAASMISNIISLTPLPWPARLCGGCRRPLSLLLEHLRARSRIQAAVSSGLVSGNMWPPGSCRSVRQGSARRLPRRDAPDRGCDRSLRTGSIPARRSPDSVGPGSRFRRCPPKPSDEEAKIALGRSESRPPPRVAKSAGAGSGAKISAWVAAALRSPAGTAMVLATRRRTSELGMSSLANASGSSSCRRVSGDRSKMPPMLPG